MSTTRVNFNNHDGAQLAATLEIPDNPKVSAIFAHCFTCSKDLKSIVQICRILSQSGIAVMRFDFSGIAQSEGDFEETNLFSNVQDLLSAVDYMSIRFSLPSLLIGHSLGGAAAIIAAEKITSLAGLVTIAAPSDSSHLGGMLSRARGEALLTGASQVTIGGSHFTLTEQFFRNLEKHDLLEHIRRLTAPYLILHAPDDPIVEWTHAETLFEQAPHPKSLLSLGKADHILSDRDDAIYAGQMIAAWIRRYLDIE